MESDNLENPEFKDYIASQSRLNPTNAFKSYITPCTSPSNFIRSIKSFFPIIDWIQDYSIRKYLIHDIIAGVIIAILHVPQGISYAFLSKVNPVNGLYASFFAPLIYMFFATSRHMSVGSFAVIALMTGAASDVIMESYYGEDYNNPKYHDVGINGVNRITIAASLTFTIGLCQLLIGALKLNFLFAYFSDPLVGGFSTGAAVHVFFSQFSSILNVKVKASNGPGFIFDLLQKLLVSIPHCDAGTLSLSIVCIVTLLFCKEYLHFKIAKCCGRKIPIPYDLILIMFTTFLSYQFLWNMPIVGDVPQGFPNTLLPQPKLIVASLSPAIAITVVTLSLHISISKMFAKQLDYKIDPGQEIYALGFTSLISGFFPCYPTSPGLSRTLVGIENGGKTQLAAIPTCLFLLSVILYVGPFFKHLPICVLSSVIIVALRPMLLKFKDIPKLWQLSKYDCFTWIVSFTATVVIDVTVGLILSFCFALFSVVLRTQWPSWSISFPDREKQLSKSSTHPIYCVYKFSGILIFTNAEEFKNGAYRALEELKRRCVIQLLDNASTKTRFIFDCCAITEIDSVGIQTAQEVITDIKKHSNISIAFACLNSKTTMKLLFNEVATWNEFYPTVEEAINSINRSRTSQIQASE